MKAEIGNTVRNRVREKRPVDRLGQLTDYLKILGQEKFTGSIRINYSQGAISRVEKFEEILKK